MADTQDFCAIEPHVTKNSGNLEASLIEEFQPETAYEHRLVQNICYLERELEGKRHFKDMLEAMHQRDALWDALDAHSPPRDETGIQEISHTANTWAYGNSEQRAKLETTILKYGFIPDALRAEAYVAGERQLAELDSQITRLELRRRKAWADFDDHYDRKLARRARRQKRLDAEAG